MHRANQNGFSQSTAIVLKGMRLTLAAIVIVGLPAVVAAQSPVRDPGVFDALPPIGLPLPRIGLPLPRIGLPLPRIGLPLPRIGLPLPPMGLPPAIDSQPRITDGHPSRGTENERGRSGGGETLHSAPTLIYVVPFYGWNYPHPAQTGTPTPSLPDSSSKPRTQEPLTGSLRLEVQPERLLQIYVDGYYVGTADDFNGELELEAGPHKIEIRAPGYETLEFDVKIPPHGSITYRGALKPVDAKPEPDPTVRREPDTPQVTPQLVPATPTTFYVIPGCYVGNVAPKDVTLPATCDRSRLITFKQ